MSCDVMVAIEINHLQKRMVNTNPCKSPKTVFRTALWACWFMRNFRKKKRMFFSFMEKGGRKLLLCSGCSGRAFSLPTGEHQKVAGQEGSHFN